jgi:hypothetical protein
MFAVDLTVKSDALRRSRGVLIQRGKQFDINICFHAFVI